MTNQLAVSHNKAMFRNTLIILALVTSSHTRAGVNQKWVPLKKGETVSDVLYEHLDAKYNSSQLWSTGGLIDQTFQDSGISRNKEKKLPPGTLINVGTLYKNRGPKVFKGQEHNARATKLGVTTVAPPPKKTTTSRHRVQIGLYSLHTELAATQNLSAGSSSSADEVLSQVRLSGSLDYNYRISSKLSFHSFLLVRWHEYSTTLALNILENQGNFAFRPHIGIIYRPSKGLELGINVFGDQQLYYFGNEVEPELFFELDTTAGIGAKFQARILKKKYIDIKPYIYGDLFSAFSDDIGTGLSIGAGLELPILKNKRFAIDVRYEQKYFDFFSSDIRQEILEMGLSYGI